MAHSAVWLSFVLRAKRRDMLRDMRAAELIQFRTRLRWRRLLSLQLLLPRPRGAYAEGGGQVSGASKEQIGR